MAVRDPVQLCELLHLPATYHEPARQASRLFPLFAPLEYIGRMRPGDPHDPLLRQVLPMAEELDDVPGYHADPVDDAVRHAAPRAAPEIPRSGPDGNDPDLCRPLPVLLSTSLRL